MSELEVVAGADAVAAPSKNAGSQTLDRGIRALEMVAAASGGMTVQDVADGLGVHRTIAHRLLATLADHRLIARGPDNRFRAGGGLTALAGGVQSTLRETAISPAMPDIDEMPTDHNAQVDLLYHERAFWLYLTGRRLGDLRRLIRNYGRSAESVFPTGTYVLFGGRYGTATAIPFVLKTESQFNPKITHGCTVR